ncbi:MAG: SAM-dependent DNA methyltransferase [Lunatimonas sp.]|uniref:type I restriction-modification system subunit M n=1 Tax=Lunatimonas sp. TaxID=2060141 RepID=UPI00263B2292|nr:class I SAM-dependent DNA methyltransferase [Lunatimonas sp.]MCC5938643.1 SAM-dependent DNA methyltransferase [Lunatimonas sp.]
MTNKKEVVGFIFQITDKVLWNVFRKNEIGDVLLPFVVLRRLDCILEPVNGKVREAYNNFKDKVAEDKLDPILRKAAGGLQFYNISRHTFESLRENPKTIEIDFNNYLYGFNKEVRDIIDNFQFEKVIGRLLKNRLLYQMIDAICKVDLHTDKIDNHDMGYIFEELIRISNEQSNETAGEHFTPRDVVQLMIEVMFSTEKEVFTQPGIIRTIYDPAMGTGGMINIAKNYVVEVLSANQSNKPTIRTYGQEINEQSYAIAKSEALITGENIDNIRHGNTFTQDRFADKKFHYMLANPPYGVTWSKDADYIINESANPAGRFYAGLPAKSDGQLLFLQHMISKMEYEGSKIAVVTNGSPLFSGGAGSGESDIRKWIISNDWLECIVALPKDLFYNTGINTFIWFLNNNKPSHRRGKVQLINAVEADDKSSQKEGFCRPEKRSLGNKRNKIEEYHIQKIVDLYTRFEEGSYCKIFDNEFFGYYQVTIEQPELDEKGKPKQGRNGELKPDTKKRDKENIPLSEDIEVYFEKEVLPHVKNAWIDFDKTRIGYEINFSKYFTEFKPLRSTGDIKAEIHELEFGNESEKGIKDLILDLFK